MPVSSKLEQPRLPKAPGLRSSSMAKAAMSLGLEPWRTQEERRKAAAKHRVERGKSIGERGNLKKNSRWDLLVHVSCSKWIVFLLTWQDSNCPPRRSHPELPAPRTLLLACARSRLLRITSNESYPFSWTFVHVAQPFLFVYLPTTKLS